MSTEEGDLNLDPTYIAGLFDSIGRVRFDISDTEAGKYTVRPMLRLKPHQTDLRAAVIDSFLDQRGYQYEFVSRGYGEEFFQLQQRSDLEDLQALLEGESAQLVRELTFVSSVFAAEFDFEILSPRDLYRFTLLRDKLRYGWRPRGRYHVSPDDLVAEHDFDTEEITVPSLPASDLRSDYSVEWIAGVYDGGCRYRPSINEDPEYKIGYAMHPIARVHRSGVSPEYISYVQRFCNDYNLPHGDSSEENSLRIVFTGASNIRRVLDILYPRLLVLAEASQLLFSSILPRFDEEYHHEKQGFYDLLRDFDQVADASGGPFRQREYDPAYFADEWRTDLDLVEPSDEHEVAESTPDPLQQLEEVTLTPEQYQTEPGRYRTLIDRATCDRETVAALKSLYNDRCQLCDARLASGDGTGFSEVHHIQPLGSPHDGPDEHSNMLVLCPNHHADFDNGVIRVTPAELTVEHPYDSDVDGQQLSVAPEHALSESALEYHDEHLCRLR